MPRVELAGAARRERRGVVIHKIAVPKKIHADIHIIYTRTHASRGNSPEQTPYAPGDPPLPLRTSPPDSRTGEEEEEEWWWGPEARSEESPLVARVSRLPGPVGALRAARVPRNREDRVFTS